MSTTHSNHVEFLRHNGEMGDRILHKDWTGSPLGPIESWPSSLRRIVRLMLGTTFPMFVLWGRHLSCLYNDGYIPVLQARHPDALGRSHADIWPELWTEVQPYIERALAGESTYFENHPLGMLAGERMEQRWFTFSFSPAYDDEEHICGVLCAGVETTDTVRAQQQLKDNERRLQQLNATLEERVAERTRERDRIWRHSQDLLLVIDGSGILRALNPAWTAQLGYTEEDLLGQSFQPFVHPDDIVPTVGAIRHALAEPLVHFEVRIRHKHGDYRWYSWSAASEGDMIYANGRDITPLKEQADALKATEAALRQAQKMEAVGQLTGGLAHDFNNLLAAMTGNLELIEFRLQQGRTNDLLPYVKSAMSVVDRAAALTHRLLAFSRRQTLTPQPTDINALVRSMENLIQRTVGPTIAIETHLAPGLWLTRCDPHQLESALLNLAINARDAMSDSGRLIIESGNAALDERYAAVHNGTAPGEYVVLSITDNGSGMSADILERAFDPFFTTKPMGQGTGLGLSMVYGFVKQSGGNVRLYSELGLGTTVKLYLPRCEDAEARPKPATTEPALTAVPEQRSNVLLVEDEDAVRSVTALMLKELGYHVMEAATGTEALAILRTGTAIDLLVTDVGLPGGMDGRQLADLARQERPGLHVLFITGYAENAAVRNGLLQPGMQVMSKPFSMKAFADKVRSMIVAA